MELFFVKRLFLNGYVVAVLATLSLLIVLKSLQPIFLGAPPALLFLFGVMLAAWHGGFRAGFLATALSALVHTYFLVEPYHSFLIADSRERLRIGLLIGVGTLLSQVISAVRKAEQRFLRSVLEREAAERRLGESEQRYRELFEHSSDAIFLLDVTSDGRFRFAELNPAEERLTGLSNAEAAGRYTEEVVPEALLARVNANFRRCVAGGAPITFEERLEFPPGTRDVNTTLIPVRNAAGDIYRLVGIVRDITERKRNEDLLREQVALEERLAKIADHAPGVMCNFRMRPDGSTCIPYAAPGLVELYCLDPEAMARDASIILPLVHPDDVERVNRSIAESARTLSPWRDEYRVRHPVKGEIWIEGCSTPQADPDGGITWYGFLHDVTERKRSEEQLALVSFALNHVREAAYLIDEQARFGYINDGACRALGYDRDELLRLGVPDVGPGWSMERWADHWRDLKAQRSLMFETDHRAKDGHTFPVEINANYFEYGGRGYNLALVRDITERKRTEAALRQSQEALAMALDAARLGTWHWDIRTGAVDWSRQCKALYGLPTDTDVTYERFLRAVHPNDRERVEAALRDTAEKGSEYRLEKRILWPDGTERWTASLGRCFLDEAGRPVRVAGVSMDITERKRIEAALRESEALYRSVVTAMAEGMMLQDASGVITAVNPAAEQIGGRTAEQMLGKTSEDCCWEAIHEDGRPFPGELHPALAALRSGEPQSGVVMGIRKPEGILTWISVNSQPLIAAGESRPHAVVTTFHDITERKRAERELRASEARFRTFVDHATDAFFLHDDRGAVLDVNRQACESLGRTREELIGMAPSEFDAGLDPSLMEGVNARLAAGEIFTFDSLHRRKDGTVFPVEIRARPFWQDGRRFGVALVRDITERKRTEEALREADRRKNEFLAMLGHELRNPLAPIRNAMQIMRRLDVDDPKLRWVRDVVDRQVGHLTRLVDDLLDVSRIVQGKLALKKAPVTLATVIEQAVETCRPIIEVRRHTLEVSLPRESLCVDGDSARLVQVFSNLLDNAAKYTPEGGRIWLTVACRNREAVISVRDTGEGLADTLLPYLFDVFTQGERTLDRAQGGLGLGLTIVRTIVALHEGRIEARSEGHGLGSEFVVHLPILEREPVPARNLAAG
jgi:PAS domain S-box-containing protein